MIELSSKRVLLYNFLLKLSGLEKEEVVPEDQVHIELRRLKDDLAPITSLFPTFMTQFVAQAVETLGRHKVLEKIEDLEFLKDSKAKLTKVLQSSMAERDALQEFKELIDLRISELEERTRPLSPPSPEFFSELLGQLNSVLNTISNKIEELVRTSKKEGVNRELSDYVESISQIYALSSDFLSGVLEREKFEDIMGSLATKLKYRDSLFALAQIKRALKEDRVDEKRYKELLVEDVKPKLVEGLVVYILAFSGSRTLKQVVEESQIPTRDIFNAIISLLNKRMIEPIERDGVEPIYRILKVEEANTTKKLNEANRDLAIAKQAVSAENRKVIDGIILRCTTLIEELEKIADIDDDLFEGDLITIEKCCKSISEFSRGLVSREGLEKLRERVTAMINAYQRFRLAFVAEKGEFLMEKNVYGDRLDEQTYLELFSSSLNTEYEREQILQYIRSHGPQIALRLAEATGMPVSKIRTHLISLKQLGQVNIGMGEREGYLLYDVPKVPQKEVLLIANFIENISKLNTDFNGCVDSLKDIRAENLSLLISSLDGMNVATKNLVEFASYDERLSETLRAFQNEVINRVNLITEIRGKIPKTKPKVSIEELLPVEVPEVDAKYADLIEFKPLVGFGAVDWDEKLCLGCKSCQEICPEAALELTSAWNISTLFKMKSEDLQNLPESRRMLYQTIKNLSKIQPTKPIQLPEEALGFGEVSYNPIKCIACKRCEERCPSEAVKVKEIWNFQEVIKLLTKVV